MTSFFVSDRIRFHRIWLSLGWSLVLFVVYLSLTPNPITIMDAQGDRVDHVAAYAILMLWFAQLYPRSDHRRMLAGALFALGISLEFGQLLTDTRTFEIADIIADGVGVALGWAVAPPRTVNLLGRLESFLASVMFVLRKYLIPRR